MTKKRWYLSAGLVVVVLGLFFYMNNNNSKANEKTVEVTEDIVDDDARSGLADRKKSKDRTIDLARLQMLQQQLSNTKLENPGPVNEKLQTFLDASGYSREEWEEISRIIERSDPYFWDNAASTLTEMHESQDPDPSWITKIEEQVALSFELESVDDTDLDGVDCRETLCKVSFVHKDADAHDRIRDILRRSDWMTESANSYGNKAILEDGRVTSYVYFTKKNDDATFIEMRKRIIEKVNNHSSS